MIFVPAVIEVTPTDVVVDIKFPFASVPMIAFFRLERVRPEAPFDPLIVVLPTIFTVVLPSAVLHVEVAKAKQLTEPVLVIGPVTLVVARYVWPDTVKFVVLAFVAVRFAIVPSDVSDEVTTFDASVVPVSVPAGATTAFVPAAVINPLPFTVKFGIALEDPHDPVFVLTVASVAAADPGPAAVISPVRAVM